MGNVEFINNDTVLEWWKDEVKKVRLFGKDGYHLSAYGFSMMFEYWMKSLKKSVTDLGLVDDSASPGDDDTPSIPAPKAVQNNVNNQSANSEPPMSDQTSIESISSKVEEVKLEEPTEPSEVKNEAVDAKENDEPKEIDANSVPLPTSASDEEEFHEASESVSS